MKERIREAFGAVRADRSIKNATLEAIAKERAKLEGQARGRRSMRPALAGILALVLLISTAGAYTAYATPVSYISLDTDSCVQLSVNRFGRVLDVKGEGNKQLAGRSALRHMAYAEAIDELISSKQVQDFIAKGEKVSFTVASEQGDELIRGIRNCESCRLIAFDAASMPVSEAKKAESYGLPLGKYKMYIVISEAGGSLTPEECKAMSMRQLREHLAGLAEMDGTTNFENPEADRKFDGPGQSPGGQDYGSGQEAGAEAGNGGFGPGCGGPNKGNANSGRDGTNSD